MNSRKIILGNMINLSSAYRKSGSSSLKMAHNVHDIHYLCVHEYRGGSVFAEEISVYVSETY